MWGNQFMMNLRIATEQPLICVANTMKTRLSGVKSSPCGMRQVPPLGRQLLRHWGRGRPCSGWVSCPMFTEWHASWMSGVQPENSWGTREYSLGGWQCRTRLLQAGNVCDYSTIQNKICYRSQDGCPARPCLCKWEYNAKGHVVITPLLVSKLAEIR